MKEVEGGRRKGRMKTDEQEIISQKFWNQGNTLIFLKKKKFFFLANIRFEFLFFRIITAENCSL